MINVAKSNQIVSLFSGCGGLDLGFRKAGFDIVWANEYDKDIWQTYEANHPKTYLDKRDIRAISAADVPECIGIIGGPPCQSWSEAGTQKGLMDERGQLFFEYIRLIREKQPLFFLAENVSGMLHKKHNKALKQILDDFQAINYTVNFKLLDAVHYGVPQERKRVIFVGYHADLSKKFDFSLVQQSAKLSLRDAIGDLGDTPLPALTKNYTNGNNCIFPNHEYLTGGFSSIYMSRNRVRSWDEPSFTIQASGRHAPIHPQANKMINIGRDKWVFDSSSLKEYRRMSVRECARIQTFSDNFLFHYKNLNSAYKMIGNAVPVNLSYALAKAILFDLFSDNKIFYIKPEIDKTKINITCRV